MGIEKFTQREARETCGKSIYPWLGGMCSVGGSIILAFGPPNDSDRCRVIPVWTFNDNNQPAVERLAHLISGKVSSVGRPPTKWNWSAATSVIVPYLGCIREFIPHRQPVIDLIIQLAPKMIFPCPKRTADSVRATYQKAIDAPPPKVETYSGLIEDPRFLAGIFDARVAIAGALNKRDLRINSTNLPLLEALAIRFGNKVHPRTDHGGYIYVFPVQTVSDYLGIVAKHVILKPELHATATSLFVH